MVDSGNGNEQTVQNQSLGDANAPALSEGSSNASECNSDATSERSSGSWEIDNNILEDEVMHELHCVLIRKQVPYQRRQAAMEALLLKINSLYGKAPCNHLNRCCSGQFAPLKRLSLCCIWPFSVCVSCHKAILPPHLCKNQHQYIGFSLSEDSCYASLHGFMPSLLLDVFEPMRSCGQTIVPATRVFK